MEKKYGFLDESDIEEGRSYLEKIFQIRIGMPHPSDIQIKEYLHKLVPDFTPEILDVLAAVGPVNPRAIIKMINSMVFRSSLFHTSDTGIAVVGWTVLEEILTPEGAAELYSKMNGGESLIKNILNNGGNISHFEQAIGAGYIDTLVRKHQAAKGHLRLFFEKSQSILKKLGSTSALEVGKQIDRIYEISNEYSRFSVPK